ncbi:MAG: MFS transporter [Syntrophobacteraceae bacterium]|nr:MFS transporter [Syntrophobacteraceae bacterium]
MKWRAPCEIFGALFALAKLCGRMKKVKDVRDRPSPLKHGPFVLFWFARVFSSVAFQVSTVAVGWQVYALSGSAFKLGLVGLTQFLPMVVLTVAAGHLADHYDRRLIVRTCQALMGFAVGALALANFTGSLHIAQIYAVVAVLGACRSFEHPTMAALLPRLIEPSALPEAATRMASATQTAVIVGPALGGLLYTLSPGVAYGVAALLFIAAGLLSTLIRAGTVPSVGAPKGFDSLFSGITYIWRRPAVLGAISLDLFAVLFGGATALLPVYARDILHTGAWGLGILRSAPALGALSMSFVIARRPIERKIGHKMFAGVIVFGIATMIFGVSRSLILSLGALVVLGAADVVSVVIRMPLVQIATPDRMRGRVSAVNSLFVGTSNQLGEFESGVTAAIFGTVPAVMIGGIGSIVIALLWMRLFPELLKADRFESAPDP